MYLTIQKRVNRKERVQTRSKKTNRTTIFGRLARRPRRAREISYLVVAKDGAVVRQKAESRLDRKGKHRHLREDGHRDRIDL